jgi:VanZ family protein
MPVTRSSSLILWLLLGVILLIMYGSLYPFHLKADINDNFWQALDQLSWARAGRGDRISNVLLYLPLGFCLFLSLNRRYRRRASLLLATLLGSSLSLAMEVAQIYVSVRVPSLTDLTLNAAGTLIGATAGLAWSAMARWVPFQSRADRPAGDPGAMLVLGLWLVWRLAPFVPHVDLGKLKAALRPLFDPQFDMAATFVYLAYWLVVSEALAALVSKTHMLEALLMLIASVLVGRLIVANQSFVAAELMALIALLPLLVVVMRMTPQVRQWMLLGIVLIAFSIDRLAPFQFTTAPGTIEWLPAAHFTGSFMDNISHAAAMMDIVRVFGQLFLFGAVVWTIHQTGTSVMSAAVTMVMLVLFTEGARLWLVDGSASLTAPLLAALVAIAFRYVYQQRRNNLLFTR